MFTYNNNNNNQISKHYVIFLRFGLSPQWQCKGCWVEVSSRSALLSHYKVKHPHFGRTARFPCTYLSCPCTFKTWNSLIVHQSRVHRNLTQKKLFIFSCHLCNCKNLADEREYFIHINTHLRKNENVRCMFNGCSFQTCIYGTFKSHKSRHHTPHVLEDFIPGVVKSSHSATPSFQELPHCQEEDQGVGEDIFCSLDGQRPHKDLIEQQLATALLQLEFLVHVPGIAVDEFLQELNYLLNSQSASVSTGVIRDILERHKVQFADDLVKDIAAAFYTSNPVCKAIEKGGSLSTVHRRLKYYKEKFCVVEPVTYLLDNKRATFQYVPLLKLLHQILSCKAILDKIVANHRGKRELVVDSSYEYKSSEDGTFFIENELLNAEQISISVRLYVDEFEVCNPLGTSRKKHKLCGVYWVLGNLPPGSHSVLSSIYLAVLFKSVDAQVYGFERVLEPLLQDLKTLETDGVFVPLLGTSLKGTVQSIIADNLAAHSIAGFVESFSGDFFCRFCTAKRCDVESDVVACGAFGLRTKELHSEHVKTALETKKHCFGVKRECIFTKNLTHFHVLTGFPPDIAHDAFEGIVPVELAYCLSALISKKYFTIDDLNKAILAFPYKWSDKTNKPHIVPQNLAARKTVGGNAHENWSLLRLLPFLIGHLVPENEPAWSVLMDLKDIVELIVAPTHSDESIAYLDGKIIEHRQRYQDLFPAIRLLPKHHFLEHYPSLIRCFGPLVTLWTLRFEAKHSYFKKIVKHTNCYKNIPLTLASKHQFMIAFHLNSPSYGKTCLDIPNVSLFPVDLLNQEIALAVKSKYPETTEVHLAKVASMNGIQYNAGMIVVHGSASGLPEFAEIMHMCVIKNELLLIVRVLCGWYTDHYRAFEITPSPTREIKLVHIKDLGDIYPLADYIVGSSRMVALKRHIVVKGLIKCC